MPATWENMHDMEWMEAVEDKQGRHAYYYNKDEMWQ